MDISFRHLKISPKFPRLTRADIIFAVLIGIIILLIGLLALDGYVFYKTFWSFRPQPVLESIPSVSSQELNEIIKLLNEGDRKLKEVLAR